LGKAGYLILAEQDQVVRTKTGIEWQQRSAD
jgi:hypothetical protein